VIVEIFLATAIRWLIFAMAILVGFAAVALVIVGLRLVRAWLRRCWRAGRRVSA